MRRLLLIVAISGSIGYLSACTITRTQDATYFTLGQAKIQECRQVIKVDNKEEIKFNCRTLESNGLSSEFAAMVRVLFGWIPWPW